MSSQKREHSRKKNTGLSVHTKQNGTEVKISHLESSFLLGFISVLVELADPFQAYCEVTFCKRTLGCGDGPPVSILKWRVSLIPDHSVNLRTEYLVNLAIFVLL